MLIAEGIVTKSGMESYVGKDGKKAENFRFALEGINFLLDEAVDQKKVPAVGQSCRAMVTRIWSQKNQREYWFVLGFVPPPPLVAMYPPQLAANGQPHSGPQPAMMATAD